MNRLVGIVLTLLACFLVVAGGAMNIVRSPAVVAGPAAPGDGGRNGGHAPDGDPRLAADRTHRPPERQAPSQQAPERQTPERQMPENSERDSTGGSSRSGLPRFPGELLPREALWPALPVSGSPPAAMRGGSWPHHPTDHVTAALLRGASPGGAGPQRHSAAFLQVIRR